MSKLALRLSLVLGALAAAAAGVHFATSNDADDPTGPGTAPEVATGDGEGFDPYAEDGQTAPAPEPPRSTRSIDDALERKSVGPALADGTEVDVAVRYKAGTVTRYRVMYGSSVQDQQTRESRGQRWHLDVTTKVLSAAPDGPVRVQLTVDAIRLEAILSPSFQFDFDSRAPDEAILADRTAALLVKPLLGIIGIPVEFHLGATGAPQQVLGNQRWTDAYKDILLGLDPSLSRTLPDPYTQEALIAQWAEFLFPPVGGGKMTAGKGRPFEMIEDTYQACYVYAKGDLHVTHDRGDVFRVSMVAQPKRLPRAGTPRSEVEAAIEKSYVKSNWDDYDAAWEFDRSAGRLVSTEVDSRYVLAVSYRTGVDRAGEPTYAPVYNETQRAVRVKVLKD